MGEAALHQVRAWLAAYGSPDACVADLLCDRHDPGAVAITEIGPDLAATDLTFAELGRRSRSLAGGLAGLGIGRGDRVATLMGKGVDLAVAVLAIWRLGAVHVPLFTAFAPSAIALRLAHSGAALVIADDDQRPKLDPGADISADAPWRVLTTGPAPPRPGEHTMAALSDAAPPPEHPAAVGGDAPFILIYTSGATGPPRGVEVPVRALAALHAYHHYGLDVADDDVYWNTADPAWAYGLYHGLVSPLLAGHRSLHLRAGFDPELTLDVLATFGVTNVAAAPTDYRTLRATIKTMPPEIWVRRLSSAGEPLTPDVVDWAADVFGTAVGDHYGQTELGMVAGAHHHPEAAAAPRPGSIGTALPGWSIEVLSPLADEPAPPGTIGRIAVDIDASPAMWFTGYRDQPGPPADRFTPTGRYYLTGDTGTRDRDGLLYFSSRDDDVILMGGYRIGPFDVESALLQHPAVTETAVYGVPDELRGQVVAASVVLAEGVRGDDALAEELKDVVRRRFAAHAYPRRIVFVDSLPKTRSGKLQRSRLRTPLTPG